MYMHGNILVCSKACLSADRHRSVQIYGFNYGNSIPLGGLINSCPIESVLGSLAGKIS